MEAILQISISAVIRKGPGCTSLSPFFFFQLNLEAPGSSGSIQHPRLHVKYRFTPIDWSQHIDQARATAYGASSITKTVTLT